MKKIIVYGLSPQKGGVEAIVLNIIKHLNSEINFDILLSANTYDSEYDSLPDNVNILYITSWGENRKAFKKELEIIFEKGNYDYLWINACLMSNRDIVATANKFPDLKVITHSHGSSFESSNILKRFLLLFLHKYNRKYYLKNVDYPCMCSNKSGLWFYGHSYINKQKVFLFKNGIETDKFKFNRDIRQNYRTRLGLDNKLVLFHAGRLTAVKNQMYLIDIVSKCKERGLKVHLLIAGDGELRQQLESSVKNKDLDKYISFLGLRQDINNLYQASDIFLLPSLHEGFPVTLTEAQTSGIKCLVSSNISTEVDITGNVEFIPITQDSINLWVDTIATFHPNNLKRIEFQNIVIKNQFDISQVSYNFKKFINA